LDYTILDVLIGFHLYCKPKVKPEKLSSRLTNSEIKLVEQVINRCLLEKGANLASKNENELQLSKLSTESWVQNRKNTLFIVRFGLVFILEYLAKERALNLIGQNLVIESKSSKIDQVYYDSIKTNPINSCLEIKLCNFWKRSQNRTIPLLKFNPKRIFIVKEIIPCKGFEIIKS
jgi:hypothetical protein